MLVVLRLPHLVLANVGDDDGLAVGRVPQIVHHVRGVEVSGVGQILDVAHRALALHRIHLAQPCGFAIARREVRQQGFEHLGQIADERHVDLNVLVDLRRIDLDVDLLRVDCVSCERASNAIIEAHAAGDEQIGLLNRLVHPCLAVHAHHAERERMRGGEAAEPEQRRGDGNLQTLGQREYLLASAGLNHAVSGKNHRTFRGANQLHSLEDRVLFRAQHGMGSIRLGRGCREIECRRSLLGILGDVDQHGAGTSRLRDEQRFADGRSNVFGARYDVIVFRHRQSNAGDVDLLESVCAEHLARDLAGDAEQRDGVHHRGGNAGHHVGRARTGGSNGHADFAGCARIAIGHVHRTLLVPDEDVADGEFAQRVVCGQNGAAGIAEDLAHALALEGGPENLGSC